MSLIDRVRALTVLVAAASVGLVAAVFVHWSETIGPALRQLDDRTFLVASQELNEAIFAPLFLGLGFTGAFFLIGLAALLQLGAGRPSAAPMIIIALGLHLAAAVITVGVHEPLNEIVRSAGDPAGITDFAGIRAAFDESTWLVWNHVRAAVEVIAFGCLAWALVLVGRQSGARTAA